MSYKLKFILTNDIIILKGEGMRKQWNITISRLRFFQTLMMFDIIYDWCILQIENIKKRSNV